ncbi:DNA-directed RNA polymerase [Pseudomonas sp. B14(2017)]|uniref:DNA-directed RNA polymerase n=1 Tax=Pseudomonas sp. B14(2017) TaxID=1981745 RepID=UPI000A1E3D53|nr:DNA-directed RNA polymerase [Pseudomonas sp. B14(2017)]
MQVVPERHNFDDVKESPEAFTLLSRLFGETMAAEQLRLEHEAYVLGEERYRESLEEAAKNGEYADTLGVRNVVAALIPQIAQAHVDWLKAQEKVRRKNVAIDIFRKLPPEMAATILLKRLISLLAAIKPEELTIQMVAIRIGKSVEEEMRYGRIRDEEAKKFKRFIEPNLAKRHGHTYKMQYMQAVEASMLEQGELSSHWAQWERDEKNFENDMRFQVGFQLLHYAAAAQLIVIERVGAGNKKDDKQIIVVHDQFAAMINDRNFSLAEAHPLYQPCVVPPKRWTGVRGGGYWARGRRPQTLIKVRNRKALERYRDVHMPEVYKALNIAQETAWRINPKTLEVANALFDWQHVDLDGFPGKAKEESPAKYEGDDEEGLKANKRVLKDYHRRVRSWKAKRNSLTFTLNQANKFAGYAAIWFPYTMDWRGRVYPVPSFNPQGTDLTKGLLMASEGAPIGAEGIEWLMVHGANTAGHDKVPFDQRKQWVMDNEELILSVANDPLQDTRWQQMDSPFCFLAFCFEWAGVVEHGEQWVSALPIAFDGSCSGIQHFSAMLRDERGGRAVNLVPSAEVQDIYRLVAEAVVKRLLADRADGTDTTRDTEVDKKTGEIRDVLKLGTRDLAEGWLAFKVDRKVTKRCVMTLPYGSEVYGFGDQILKDTVRPSIEAGKGSMFEVDPQLFARYLAGHIYASMGSVVRASVSAMGWLKAAAKLLAAEVKDKKTGDILKPRMAVHWTTPDGFPVWQEYFVPVKRRVDLMFHGQQRIQATVIVKDSSDIDGRKMESSISPNFVHSMDGSHLRKTVVHSHDVYGVKFFALIHDSFGTIPAHAGFMFRAVRETMVETYENNNVLQDFADQFIEQLDESQELPPIPEMGTLDIRQILESDFAFA